MLEGYYLENRQKDDAEDLQMPPQWLTVKKTQWNIFIEDHGSGTWLVGAEICTGMHTSSS